MAIVVIHWKIKRGFEKDFLEYWSQSLLVDGGSKLVGEFLSRPMTPDEVGFPCTTFGREPGAEYVSFFNVGLWPEHDAFYQEIVLAYVKDAPAQFSFEAKPRERMVLRPQLWRIRTGALPSGDHVL